MKILAASLLAIVLLPAASMAAERSTYDPGRVAAKLRGSAGDQREAVRLVLDNTARANATLLFTSSIVAHQQGQLEDAGFLFYAAQMRAYFDVKRFQGGDAAGGPNALFGALHAQIGEVINPAIVRDPPAYARIVERLESWDVATPKGYEPEWATRGPVRGVEQGALAVEAKERLLQGMRPMARLLQDPEYFAAFTVLQEFNLAPFAERQDPQRLAAKTAAEQTLLRIERREGLSVLSSLLGAEGP